MHEQSGRHALILMLAFVGVALTGCSDGGGAGPDDQDTNAIAVQLSAELQRLDARRSSADAELAGAEQDWSLYQQGWQEYQAAHPTASIDLLRCAPERFAGEAKVIGAAGGTIQMGAHRLTIPAGALMENVVITGELTTGPLVAVDLSPHGLTFQKPVLLQLATTHCADSSATRRVDAMEVGFEGDDDNDGSTPTDTTGTPGTRVREIVHIDSSETILEHLPSTNDGTGTGISAWLTHFSRYAVWY